MTKYLLIATLAFGTIACTREQRTDMRTDTEATRARTETAADNWENERREYSRRMQDRMDRIDREMEEERAKAKGREIDWSNYRKGAQKCSGTGEALFCAYEYLAEPFLTQDYRTDDGNKSVPVFVVDYPLEVSPLARKKDSESLYQLLAIKRVREEMERAQARRLQPHFIGSFFREAFQLLGGRIAERENGPVM